MLSDFKRSRPNEWFAVKERVRELRKEATPAECILWEQLRGNRLAGFKFRRQHAIGTFIVDFYCREAKLVIEVDGEIHDQESMVMRDTEREEFIRNQGLRIIRFTNYQIENNLRGVMLQISDVLKLNNP